MNAVLQDVTALEMSEDELESIERDRERKLAVLNRLGTDLEADKDKAVRWRVPIEQRWIEDLRQKFGETGGLADTKGSSSTASGHANPPDTAEFRKTIDNITRPAVKQISARIADMLFPTNERNWDLKPSPLPELANPDAAVTDPITGEPMTKEGPPGPNGEPGQPQPLTAADVAALVQKQADQRAERMRAKIDDALTECKYAKQGRAAINDGCDYGTGVLKSPVVRRHKRTSFHRYTMPDGQVIPEIKVNLTEKPGAEHVDIWNFYPQPCKKIDEAEHAFEAHWLTKKKVRELAKQPGFDPEQVNALLKLEPDAGALRDGGALMARDQILSPTLEAMDGRYCVWEYHGPIPREALEVFGIAFDEEDKLSTVNGEVWFCQGIVLKATLAADEYDDCLPYRVWNYEKDPSCVFGFSVPYELRNDQLAVNQTWHAVILNAMMSSGTQVGVVPGMMESMNGRAPDLTCLRPRTWALKQEVADIRQVLSFWNMPNFTAPLMQVYETARRNGADKLMLPAYQEGRAAEVTKTSSGLAMLMNSANIVQREAAKNWDDGMTLPIITSHSRWFLLNDDDEDAKGDYDASAKGESYLLVKDVQAQHVQVLTSIAENPRWAAYFDDWELLQLNVKTLSVPVDGLLRDRQTVEAEMKANQGQPDPETIKAQAAQAQADSAVKRAELEAQNAQRDDEFRRYDRDLDFQQHQMTMRDRAEQRIADLTVQQGLLELEYAKLGAAQENNERAAMLKERIAANDAALKEMIAGMKARLDAEKIAANERKVATEIQVESPSPRLA